MIHPTIHTNGTSREALLDDACTAVSAIAKAIDAANAAGPNARDYYTQGDDAFAKARAEHDARIARLVEVRKEYETLAEAIADPFARPEATAKDAADLRDPATRACDRLNSSHVDELRVLRELAAASKALREHTGECITAMAANEFVCQCENTEQTERVCEAIADWEMLS